MTATTVTYLLLLARLLVTDPAACGAARAAIQASAPQPLTFFGDQPLHDMAFAGDALIVVSGAGRERQVVRSTRRGDERLQSMSLRGARGRDEIVVTGERWWYGSTGERDGAAATTFVSDDGSGRIATSSVPVSGRGPYLFLPLHGEAPRGLQFSSEEGGATLVAEVDATHALRTWHLPPLNLLNTRIGAEPLPDGRIALFVVRPPRLALVMLRDQQEFSTIALREAEPFQFATAVDAKGRIAIVTATVAPGGETIEGAVLDPEDPASSRWHVLSRDARLAAWPALELRLVGTDTGFLAAWIDRSVHRRMQLQACDVTPGDDAPAIANVGEPTEGRVFGAFFAVQPAGKDLLFFWDDGRHLVMRRVQSSIAQLAATQRVAESCVGTR